MNYCQLLVDSLFNIESPTILVSLNAWTHVMKPQRYEVIFQKIFMTLMNEEPCISFDGTGIWLFDNSWSILALTHLTLAEMDLYEKIALGDGVFKNVSTAFSMMDLRDCNYPTTLTVQQRVNVMRVFMYQVVMGSRRSDQNEVRKFRYLLSLKSMVYHMMKVNPIYTKLFEEFAECIESCLDTCLEDEW